LLSRKKSPILLPVGKNLAKLALNFLPVGKRGLAQMRAVDIIDILPPIWANLGACCAAEDTRLVVTAEEPQVEGFGNIVAGVTLENRQDFHLFLFRWKAVSVSEPSDFCSAHAIRSIILPLMLFLLAAPPAFAHPATRATSDPDSY
jgi:hypothetical protein